MAKGRQAKKAKAKKVKKARESDEDAKQKKRGGKRGGHHQHQQLFGQQNGLRSLGLRAKKVTADGNCLFRAVCDQIFGEDGEEDHNDVRQKVVQAIEDQEEQYAPFMEDDESFKDYCSRMRSDGEWGGNLELQVIAGLYNVRIIIHQDSGAPALCIQPERKTVSEIHILLQEEHYDSVRNNDDYGDGPPTEIILGGKGVDAENKQEEEDNHSGLIKILMENTGCEDGELARKHLRDADGDADLATESLISALQDLDLEKEVDREITSEDKSDQTHADEDQHQNQHQNEKDRVVHQPDPDSTKRNNAETTPPSPQKRNPGRNVKCPCGSGLKYKACCRKKKKKKEDATDTPSHSSTKREPLDLILL